MKFLHFPNSPVETKSNVSRAGNKLWAILWVAVLAAVAVLVIIMVNFGFQENILESELIEHTSVPVGEENISVCLLCNKKRLTYCKHCGSPMNWNKTSRHFICPSCQTVGLPLCPHCQVWMYGLNVTKKVRRRLIIGSPIPVY